MPRDLSDVLHYFIPELSAREEPASQSGSARPLAVKQAEQVDEIGVTSQTPRHKMPGMQPDRPAALPIIGVPMGERDMVRAAFTWNLAVEISRLGGRAIVVTPGRHDPSPLWPEAGIGPLGAELIPTPANDLGALYRVAIDTAVSRAHAAEDGGVILVRIPPPWLRKPAEGAALLRWMLVFSSANERDLREAYGIAKLLLDFNPKARVGVTIYGARERREAERAFSRLARSTQKCIDADIVSYGLLVDDLDVYRAIVAQRPIGLTHPQSPAARALRDVAQMLLDDARKRAVV